MLLTNTRNKATTKKYLHTAISLALMFFFRFIPPIAP